MVVAKLLRLFALPARLCRPRVAVGLVIVLLLTLLAAGLLWPHLSYRRARQALDRQRPREARARLAPALKAWPASAEVHLLAAEAARLTGDYEAAEKYLRQCQRLEGKPSDASVLEWSLLRAETGDLKGVEAFLRSRIERQPDRAGPILEALAAGYLRVYRFFDAMSCLDDSLRRNPDSARALYLRGRAWERVHSYRKAAADYERAVALDPDNDDARLRLANALLENGEPSQAIAPLEELRRRQPDNAEVLIRLAFTWLALGRLEDSTRLVDEVLRHHPDLPLALSARGQLAFQAEQMAEAETWLRRAVTLDPFDRQGLYVLQQCLEQQGKKDEARRATEQLKEVEGLLERLIAISNRLMPRTPNDPALHHELGSILEKMGHRELALRWFQSALEQDPDYRPAREALERFKERT